MYTLSLVLGTLTYGQMPANIDSNIISISKTLINSKMIDLLENRKWLSPDANGNYVVNVEDLKDNIEQNSEVDLELINNVPNASPTTSYI